MCYLYIKVQCSYLTVNDRTIVKDSLERMFKELVVAYFMVLSQHLGRETEVIRSMQVL
jgi:hypothetical protein